ncbi:hypothetical protein LAZ67_16002269 [Cordylochernes scorpioides]|uniref:SPIN-DOC-like zinc-finger domain-containing protein n=1 Tax=Cordylochernes scorpioides TaxID=51811 RepID=A0ABY6LBV1_9ARAC|nr:hypothetical protein LAZ67_16002269 [Cordylochernes scorpioides]
MSMQRGYLHICDPSDPICISANIPSMQIHNNNHEDHLTHQCVNGEFLSAGKRQSLMQVTGKYHPTGTEPSKVQLLMQKRPLQTQNTYKGFSRKVGIRVFCSEVKDKIICLICNNAISVPKLYNIKRHYEQHKSKYDTYEGLMRQEKLKEFKLRMKKQQFMFTKVSQESEAAVHASYVLSEMIAKHSKPFTEGDFIKECLIKAAEIVCPGSVKTFQAISLSRNTVVERVTDMARNLNDQIKEKSSCFEAFSIACDESLSYYTEVCWLSCSKVLKQFWDLKEEICQFFITKNKDITLFSDQVWLQDFSFMVDITKHLSDLNLKLQGKDQIITNMCDQVNAFKCKLVLWEKQLKNEDLMHFPTCNMYKSSLGETASYQKYAEKF